MNKNIKRTIAITLMLALIAGCFATLPIANAASKPVPGNPGWQESYRTNVNKGTPAPTLWDRGNAAGDKIPSNAHSADFPGLYFYWDDKQKDDGVLLVNENVFAYFKGGYTLTLPNVDKKQAAATVCFAEDDPGFVLTAKNSNNYWGYKIAKSTGKVIDTVNGVKIYAYAIPKQIQFINPNNGKNDKEDLKNINMVFIDGQYKDAQFEIVKKWYDEKGKFVKDGAVITELNGLLKFNGYSLGVNNVKITDYNTAVYGKQITVTENVPAGYFEKGGNAKQSITVRYDDDPIQVVTFKNQKEWACIRIEKVWLDAAGVRITDEDRLAKLDAEFTINGKAKINGQTVELDKNIQVKDGTYTITEKEIKGFELVCIRVDPVSKAADYLDTYSADITVAAGKTKTITFVNREISKTPAVHAINKVFDIDGKLVAMADLPDEIKSIDGFIESMTFRLYRVDDQDAFRSTTKEYTTLYGLLPVGEEVVADKDGVIDFTDFLDVYRGTSGAQVEGYYFIVETLGYPASSYFTAAKPLLVYITEKAIISDLDFDVDALYTIVNGYTDRDEWGYPNGIGYEGLNNSGDIFYIGVTNPKTGTTYDSFCAHGGSRNFDEGADKYKVVPKNRLIEGVNYDVFLAAFNYIEDHYGHLNTKDNRVITQTVIWALLGDITLSGDIWENQVILSAEQKIAVKGIVAFAEANPGNLGKGSIVDVAYLVSVVDFEIVGTGGFEPKDNFEYRQPQIVPLYGEKVSKIINTPIEQTATIKVTKAWIDSAGNDIDAPEGIEATLTNDWKFNESKNVNAGESVNFKENDIPATTRIGDWYDIGEPIHTYTTWTVKSTSTINGIIATEYERTLTVTQRQAKDTLVTSYEFVSVSIDGMVFTVNAVDFDAVGGKAHVVIFTNKVVETPDREERDNRIDYHETKPEYTLPGKIDTIPSDSHVALWFAKYDILVLAYGAQSTDSGKYFIAFDANRYSSVTVGFGSSATDAATNGKSLTCSADDVETLDCNVREILDGIISGNGWHKPEGYGFDMTALESLAIVWFDNPWDGSSGSRQIWLLNVVPA